MKTQEAVAIPVRYAEGVEVGDSTGVTTHHPTEVQLFRYCAVTWNAHRIHYDPGYAASEGYPNVLVQSHLHGAFLTGVCTEWMGQLGELRRLKYSVRRFACPGDVLNCSGTVTAVSRVGDNGMLVTLDLREVRESDGVECAIGDADVYLPFETSLSGQEGR
jgi:hydroxyacyl-ACP dehydratase HTD2-like protein with hotdog domain